MEPSLDEIREWADALIRKQAWVLHLEALAVGPVKAFYDGVSSMWTSTVDGQPVPDPVLELENGHAFIASPAKFQEMNAASMRFFASLQHGISGLVSVAARSAAATGVSPETGYALTISALRAQLVALETKTQGGEETIG
jgi:hypothetical protein